MQIRLANPRGFCAGVDIKELAEDSSRIVGVNKGNYDTFKAIHLNPKPVIVALHGFVLGGGIGIAGAADIILCSDCARFGVPEIDRGAMGGASHLQRMFGVAKVRAAFLTGGKIGADEAYRLGGIEKVVPREELESAVQAWAEKIAAQPRLAMALTKQACNQIEDLQGKRSGMDMVYGYHHFAHANNTIVKGDYIAGFDGKKMAEANKEKMTNKKKDG